MSSIALKYGRGEIPFKYDESRFQVLGGASQKTRPLTDAEIGRRLAEPISSPPIEDLVSTGESVLLVVPDATRQTACGQVVNLLVRRLIANGTAAFDMRIIFATGIHRTVTDAEKAALVTPFILQRIKTIDHQPRDIASLMRLGETSAGIPIELNRALREHDHVIIIGGITFHYFAGFTGGRKLICPGLASSKTINGSHKLAFDCVRKARRDGVSAGLLEGNAVHEAFMESVSTIDPAFAISTIVDDAGNAVGLFCGNWMASHQEACESYAAQHVIYIEKKRDTVLISCGGYPHDINMIQAHKALEAASHACTEGGTIILLAECADGLGRNDFLNWFESSNSTSLAERLCERYQVNGQTAWSLLQKAERFDVRILTSLDEFATGKMRLKKISALADLGETSGYIIPNGAKYLIRASG